MRPIWLLPAVLFSLSAGLTLRTETQTFECPPAPEGTVLAAIHQTGTDISCVYDHRKSPERGAPAAHEKRGKS